MASALLLLPLKWGGEERPLGRESGGGHPPTLMSTFNIAACVNRNTPPTYGEGKPPERVSAQAVWVGDAAYQHDRRQTRRHQPHHRDAETRRLPAHARGRPV